MRLYPGAIQSRTCFPFIRSSLMIAASLAAFCSLVLVGPPHRFHQRVAQLGGSITVRILETPCSCRRQTSMNSASWAPVACSAYQSSAFKLSRGLKIDVIVPRVGVGRKRTGYRPNTPTSARLRYVFFSVHATARNSFAATSSLSANVHNGAVPINSADTEIGRAGSTAVCHAGLSLTRSFCYVKGSGPAHCGAGKDSPGRISGLLASLAIFVVRHFLRG